MHGIGKTLGWIVAQLTRAGMICLMGMALLTCVDVVGRYFGRPVFGSVELVGFMATLAVAMALPYTHQVKGHIGVELVVRLFPPKFRRIIELCTGILGMLFFALVAWRIAAYGYTIQASGEVSMSLEFPEYVIIYMVSFCFFVFFLMILGDIVQQIETLREEK